MDAIKPALWIAGASLALAACTVVPPLEYASDHPANAAAAEAPEPHTPSPLATYKSFSMERKRQPETAPQGDSDGAKKIESGNIESPGQESGHEHAH
jgi:hypothetical protein